MVKTLEERGLAVVEMCSVCGKRATLSDGSPCRALVRIDAPEPKLVCRECMMFTKVPLYASA